MLQLHRQVTLMNRTHLPLAKAANPLQKHHAYRNLTVEEHPASGSSNVSISTFLSTYSISPHIPN